jgi:hypothetical protein
MSLDLRAGCTRIIIEIPDGGTDQNKVADFLTILGADMDVRITKLQASFALLATAVASAIAAIPASGGEVLGTDDVAAIDAMEAQAESLTADLAAATGGTTAGAPAGDGSAPAPAAGASVVGAIAHVGNASVGAS